jgi:hypothetical protein
MFIICLFVLITGLISTGHAHLCDPDQPSSTLLWQRFPKAYPHMLTAQDLSEIQARAQPSTDHLLPPASRIRMYLGARFEDHQITFDISTPLLEALAEKAHTLTLQQLHGFFPPLN